MSCGVGRRCSSNPMLLWLWCRLAAVAPVSSLAWEPPYAVGAALEKTKKKKKKGFLEHFFQFVISKTRTLVESVTQFGEN